jgi:serine/threonine-protein kinase RsbW
VVPDVRTDVEVALTEACGNVIRHAQQGEEYEVHIGIEDDLCAIDVVDTGRGWDASMLESAPDGRTTPDLDAQRGRGLHMIQVLTDNARFDNHPRSGAIVHFEKTLEWDEGAPLVP